MSLRRTSDNLDASSKAPRLLPTLILAGIAGFVVELLIMLVLPLLDETPIARFGDYIDAMLVSLLVSPIVVIITLTRHKRVAASQVFKIIGNPGLRLRLAYLSTFGLVAILLLILQTHQETQLLPYRDDGGWINLVGRQQAQSQRIASLMNRLITDDNPDNAAITSKQIDIELDKWNNEADELQKAYTSRIGAEKIASRTDYNDAESVRKVLARAANLVCQYTERNLPHADIAKAASRYLKYDGPYLDAMDRAARQLAEDQKAAIHQTISSMKLTTFSIIGVLMLTGMIILEPAVRRVTYQHTLINQHAAEMEKLGKIVERTNSSVIITDQHRRITWINDGFTKMTGYTLSEVVGKTPGSFLQCDETDLNVVRRMRETLSKAEPFRCELLNKRKDGTQYWLDLDIIPTFDSQSRLIGFMSIERDITKQVEMRDQLRVSEGSLRSVVEGADLGTWDLDFESNSLKVNATVIQMLGLKMMPERINPDSWVALIHDDDREAIQDAMQNHLQGAAAEIRCEHRLRHADGSWGWYQITGRITVRTEEGMPIRASGVLIDISYSKEAQRQLELARDAAEQANRAKSDFLANMSHEIRTPMTGIIGYAHLLGDDSAIIDPEKRKEYVNIITRNGEHLLAIINDILDIAKIEAGKMSVEMIEADPAQLSEHVLSLLRVRAVQKGIELNVKYQSSIPTTIKIDPIRLKQVLVNLIGNAIKFTENGGVTLEISCNTSNPDQCMMKFNIIDTGLGMTDEQISRLFQAFEQADTSMTRRFGGTGLGLRISQRLTQIMGGRISVTSTPGSGSMFSVELPVGALSNLELVDRKHKQLKKEAIAQTQKNQPAAVRLEGIRVLFADDAADNRNLVTFYMKKAGATITTVENGKLEVQSLCQNGDFDSPLLDILPYDVIISDMQMPEMDGYTAVAKLREKGCELPIIALTAHSMNGDDAKCFEAGCDAFATKPIDFIKLAMLIQQAASGELRSKKAA